MNDSHDREHEFAERYLRGDLNAKELADFERLLNEDSAARERFRRAARLDANLRSLATESQVELAAWRKPGTASVGRRSAANQVMWKRPGTWRWLSGILATALLLAVVFWFSPITHSAPEPLATLRSLAGNIQLRDPAGTLRPAKSGETLSAGQALVAGDGESQAELILSDNSEVTILSNSVLAFPASTPHRLHLEQGSIQVEAAPQEPGRPLIITTEHSRVTVTGTRFRLYSDRAASRVELDEGKVLFKQQSDGQTVEVAEGFYAVAEAEDQVLAEPRKLVAQRQSSATYRLQKTLMRAGRTATFAPDGKRIATSNGRQVKVWDVQSGDLLSSFQHSGQGELGQFAFTENDEALVSIDSTGMAIVWTIGAAEANQTALRSELLRRSHISTDGGWLVQGSGIGEVAVWKLDGASGSFSLARSFAIKPTGVAMARTGPLVAISQWDGTIRKFDVVSGREVSRHKLAKTPIPLAISDDGRFLSAYANSDGLVLIDDETGERHALWPGGGVRANHLRFSADGKILLAAMDDGLVRGWAAADGRPLLVLESGDTHVRWLDVSTDATRLTTVGDHESVKIWECEWPR